MVNKVLKEMFGDSKLELQQSNFDFIQSGGKYLFTVATKGYKNSIRAFKVKDNKVIEFTPELAFITEFNFNTTSLTIEFESGGISPISHLFSCFLIDIGYDNSTSNEKEYVELYSKITL